MEKETGRFCFQGLSFFGKTNRLISHELKNVLAIMSETMGLMDELTKLSEKGRQLEPGKLSSLSESIIEEVERANTIIRNMNAFGHSVDEIITDVDIRQSLTLVMGLCQLDPALRKIKTRLADGAPCTVHTSPFLLNMLLHHLLKSCLRASGQEDDILISLDCGQNEMQILFSGITSSVFDELPSKEAVLFIRALSAEISKDAAAGKLYVALPKKTDESHILRLISDE